MIATIVTQNNGDVKVSAAHTLVSAAYFPASTKKRFKATHQPSQQKVTHTFNWNNRHTHAAQNRRIRAADRWTVSAYADMLTVKANAADNGIQAKDTTFSGGGKRGEIRGFSSAARLRMMRFLAQIRQPGAMIFATLTYDDGAWLKKSEAHQRDCEALRKRFERQYPGWSAIWRVEVKQRLSGELKSLHVPHFHLIIFTNKGMSDDEHRAQTALFQNWLIEAWHEITSSSDENHLLHGVDVKPVTSRKQAFYYVSKYVAKIDCDGISAGRRYGRIGKFNTEVSVQITLDDDEYTALKRLIKRWLRSRTKNGKRSFLNAKFVSFGVFGIGDNDVPFAGDGFERCPFAQFINEVLRQTEERQRIGIGHNP